jgi:hypothetical protein
LTAKLARSGTGRVTIPTLPRTTLRWRARIEWIRHGTVRASTGQHRRDERQQLWRNARAFTSRSRRWRSTLPLRLTKLAEAFGASTLRSAGEVVHDTPEMCARRIGGSASHHSPLAHSIVRDSAVLQHICNCIAGSLQHLQFGRDIPCGPPPLVYALRCITRARCTSWLSSSRFPRCRVPTHSQVRVMWSIVALRHVTPHVQCYRYFIFTARCAIRFAIPDRSTVWSGVSMRTNSNAGAHSMPATPSLVTLVCDMSRKRSDGAWRSLVTLVTAAHPARSSDVRVDCAIVRGYPRPLPAIGTSKR